MVGELSFPLTGSAHSTLMLFASRTYTIRIWEFDFPKDFEQSYCMIALKYGQIKVFKEKNRFFVERVVGSALEISTKRLFTLDKY